MRFFPLLFFFVVITACSNKEDATSNKKTYFDLKKYFEKEASRLEKHGTIVEKTVSQNNQSEKKHIKISNWDTEFELFSNSDINKPAWRNSYRTIKKANEIQYLSSDNALKTQTVYIRFDGEGVVKQISILNKTSNILYSSVEELNYFPDSLYSVKKHQDVLISGENLYQVTSRFKTKIQ